MATSTPVPQGSLNRLLASVVIDSFPELNVTSGYLAPEAIRFSRDDNATDMLPTMTGMVTSPKPYQNCSLTIALVKSTPIAPLYEAQFQEDTRLGQITVYPDSSNILPYILLNMVLESVRELGFGGTEVALIVTLRGYYPVNQSFFNS
jgi:hypothetical protein